MWPINGTLTDTITPSKRGSWTNDDEAVFYIPKAPGLDPHVD